MNPNVSAGLIVFVAVAAFVYRLKTMKSDERQAEIRAGIHRVRPVAEAWAMSRLPLWLVLVLGLGTTGAAKFAWDHREQLVDGVNYAANAVPIIVQRLGQANASPVRPTLVNQSVTDTSGVFIGTAFAGQAGRTPQKSRFRITTAADVGFASPVYVDTVSYTDDAHLDQLYGRSGAGASVPLSEGTNYIADISYQDEAGVWSPPSVAAAFTTSSSTISVTLTGTITATTAESDIVTGGKTLILTAVNDTFIAAGTGPIGSTANTQAIIDGCTSAQSEAQGWNNIVRDSALSTTDVARTSNAVATITLPAAGTYAITADENVTCTVPAAVLDASASAVVATPSATIGNAGGTTPFCSDGFESGDLTAASGCSWTQAGGATVETTVANTGTYSMRLRYGPNSLGSDDTVEPRFDLLASYSEVWVEYYLYMPTNFVHRSDPPQNNKLFAIWANTYTNSTTETHVVLEYQRTNDTTSWLRISSAKADGYETRNPDAVATIADTLFLGSAKGTWLRIRHHIKSADNASIVDTWRDANKIGELPSDYSIYNPSWSAALNQLRYGYLLGWSNSGFASQTDFYIDDLKFYDSDPGW